MNIYNLKIMLGCMVESSLAVSAAYHLSADADWLDLDGNLLITNDPFTGVQIREGILHLPERAGIGAHFNPQSELDFKSIS